MKWVFHRWTIREDRILIANYPTHSYVELANLIDLTPLQVRNRLKKLGLKKPGRKTYQRHAVDSFTTTFYPCYE